MSFRGEVKIYKYDFVQQTFKDETKRRALLANKLNAAKQAVLTGGKSKADDDDEEALTKQEAKDDGEPDDRSNSVTSFQFYGAAVSWNGLYLALVFT